MAVVATALSSFESVDDYLSDVVSVQCHGCDDIIIASGWSVDSSNKFMQSQHAMPSCQGVASDRKRKDREV